MKGSILSFFLTLMLVVTVIFVPSVVSASPGTLYVDDDYTDSTPGWGVNHFATIQAAIYAASPGDTILVAAGTYTENIGVGKSVTIQSQNGASETIVDGSTTPNHTFNVTKDNVNITGFTVKGATAEKNAGIYLDQVESCNISANTCLDNYYGICLDNSSNNTLTKNTANSNTKHGIYIDGDKGNHGNTLNGNTANQNSECGIYVDSSNNNTLTDNTISGNGQYGINLDKSNSNTLTGNRVTGNNIGVKIEGPVDASTISINFNNITGNTEYGVENNGSNGTADATHNWWGCDSGPERDTNPGGTGNKVSDNVDYDPWLGAGVEDCKTETTAAGDHTVDAKDETDTEVRKSGEGTPTVTVVKYSSKPGTGFSGDISKYVDVHIDDDTNVDEIEIKLYYTDAEIAGLDESSLRVKWSDGTEWLTCSNSGVNVVSNYMWVKIRATDTTPNLSQLTGTPFGGQGSPLVGGSIYPMNKLALLSPWIALGLVIIAGAIIFVRHRRAWS